MIIVHRIFDSVIGNLAKNFAEGTEYFKVCTLCECKASECMADQVGLGLCSDLVFETTWSVNA